MWFADFRSRISGNVANVCSRQRQRRIFMWLLGVALVNVIAQKLYMSVYKNTCSTEHSLAAIADTCNQYKTGVVDGSLCPALCDDDVIVYRHCVNWRFGKIVAYMDYARPSGRSQRLVLKARLNPPDNNFTLYDFVANKDNFTSMQLIQSFKKNLVKLLKQNYDFSFADTKLDLMSYMWGYNVTKYIQNTTHKPDALRTALRSIWYLTQQREYVFSRIHQKYSFATKVVGTCGAMYFLEYAKSLSELKSGLFRGRGLSIYRNDWQKRAEHAVKILQLLPTLQTNFHQPLLMCDIKEANFGLRDNSDIVLIDSDDIHYAPSITNEIAGLSCTQHVHCGRLTCPARCDKQQRKCSGERTNNDLQSVCERVFLNKVGFAQTGLLSGAPSTVNKELSILLDRCAYPPSGSSPTWDDRHVTHKPPDTLRGSLIDVLERGITA